MLYEFKCDLCEHEFQMVLKMDERNEPLIMPCPNCEVIGEICRIYASNAVQVDSEMLKADKRMEESGVQQALERIRDNVNPNMMWKG